MKILPIILILLLFVSCNGSKLDKVFKKSSPYEQYLGDLTSSNLHQSALVRDWIMAGETILQDSMLVELPYQELGYFEPTEPKAAFFRFPVREGQQLQVVLSAISQPDSQFFLDLFEVKQDGSLARITSANESHSIIETVSRSAVYAIRIQPEVLRGGVYELTITYQASLAFPIPEKTSRNVASFFGDARDGGVRRHEGIDVFATRGTPVVAVADGRISRVGTNRLGGKTVSLYGNGYSFYYAHLDSQLVQIGRQVKAGDTLGWVGNTGNAITTAPHLHFGIYSRGQGSVDPIFFFRDASTLMTINLADTIAIGDLARIKGKSVNLRTAPSTASAALTQLSENTILSVEGKSGSWLRVRLPHQQQGFIAENLVENTDRPLKKIELKSGDFFKSDWTKIPYQTEWEYGEAEIIGEFETYNLVRTASGRTIWHQQGE